MDTRPDTDITQWIAARADQRIADLEKRLARSERKRRAWKERAKAAEATVATQEAEIGNLHHALTDAEADRTRLRYLGEALIYLIKYGPADTTAAAREEVEEIVTRMMPFLYASEVQTAVDEIIARTCDPDEPAEEEASACSASPGAFDRQVARVSTSRSTAKGYSMDIGFIPYDGRKHP